MRKARPDGGGENGKRGEISEGLQSATNRRSVAEALRALEGAGERSEKEETEAMRGQRGRDDGHQGDTPEVGQVWMLTQSGTWAQEGDAAADRKG